MEGDEGRRPEETLAMLFSDVESSTQHLGEMGSSYDESLARHHEILRNAFTSHHGEEVHNAGDGFFVVFESVEEAVDSAIEAQRRLRRTEWPDGIEFRVRIGIHLGPTRWRPLLGFSGLEVHRASRISDAAHGGQCLISDDVRTALLASGFDRELLVDRGRHRLKGFDDRPERLFEIVVDGWSDDRPLRARSVESVGLPTFSTPHLGREEAMAEIVEQLEDRPVRLVTLAGPGGVGKTRLAIEYGRRRQGDRRVRLIDLAGLDRPELVAQTVAEQLALSVSADRTAAETVADHLAEEPTLLLLDNLEQLLPSVAVIADWLDVAPGLQVLATSRRPLRIRQEHVVWIDPLPIAAHQEPSAATDLFVAAAAEYGVRDAFDHSPDAVAEICRSVDGLPLAIEMAASRVRSFGGVGALATAMRQPLQVLSSAPMGTDDRHASMADTIDFSVRLLSEPARDLLFQLAVLPAGANLSSATALAGTGEGPAMQAAGELVDSGLITVTELADSPPRLGTPRLIREFGLDRLQQAGETGAARLRAADHLQQMARLAAVELLGKRQYATMAHLDREIENFRAMFTWSRQDPSVVDQALASAADLVTYWWLARPHEGLEWLRSLADDLGQHSRHRPRALVRSALLASWLGETETVMARAQLGVDLCRERGRKTATLSHGLQLLALAWAASGRRSWRRRALAAVDEGLEIDQGLPSQLQAIHLTNHGDVLLAFNQLDRARPLFQRSIDLFNEQGESWLIAAPTSRLGEIHLRQGRIERAREVLYKSVQLWIGSHSLSGPARALAGLARAARADGDAVEAAALHAEAWQLVRSSRSHGEAPWVLAGIGAQHIDNGHAERGLRTLAASVSLGRSFGQPIQACIQHELGDPVAQGSARDRRRFQRQVDEMQGLPIEELLALGDD